MSFSAKTVLVTGSSRGIGLAIASAFAKAGHNVILNASKSQEELIQACNTLKAQGLSCLDILADVSDYSECQRLFAEATAAFGPIEVLINNAGIAHIGLFSDMTPAEWTRLTDVNLHSIFHTTHLAVPDMVQKKAGVLLNISSIWGKTGASCEAVYAATKGAIHAFTRSMAKELGPSGIRVNAIACGVIETGMNAWLSQDERQTLVDEIPLMRFGQAEEVAQLALFLAGDSAPYLTGQILTIDGGML